MKYKKPSSASVSESATLLGGVVAGGAVSKGILGLIHKDKEVALSEADQKKEDNTKMAKRAGLVIVGLIGASAINGNDTITALVKGALTGMAGAQALELVSDFSSKNDKVKTAVSGSSATKRFLAQTLGVKGLGCPCNESSASLNAARRHKRNSLRMYVGHNVPVFEQQTSGVLALANAS